MAARIYITILLSLMTCSVLFGIGAVAVLSVPALSEQAKFLLPVVIAASFVIGPVIAWRRASRRNLKRNFALPLSVGALVVVAFLVAGGAKAGVLKEVLHGPRDPARLPAQLIQPHSGELLWLVDLAAAGCLAQDAGPVRA